MHFRWERKELNRNSNLQEEMAWVGLLMHVGGCGYPGKSCHTRYKNIWHFMSNRFLNLYLCIRVSTSILAIWWHIWSHILHKNQTWKGLSSSTKSIFVYPNFHIWNIQIFQSICTWRARPYQFTRFNMVLWAFDEIFPRSCRRINTGRNVRTLRFSAAITRSDNKMEAVPMKLGLLIRHLVMLHYNC